MLLKNTKIDKTAHIGKNVTIHPFTQILAGVQIGDNVKIGHNCFIGENVIIGDNSNIQGNCFIPEGVIIGDEVFIGPNTTFTNVKAPRAAYHTRSRHEKHIEGKAYQQTIIKNGVTIGAGVKILCGTTLEEGCMIGMGSVLTHSVPSWKIVAGNPAKVIGMCNEKGETVYSTKLY